MPRGYNGAVVLVVKSGTAKVHHADCRALNRPLFSLLQERKHKFLRTTELWWTFLQSSRCGYFIFIHLRERLLSNVYPSTIVTVKVVVWLFSFGTDLSLKSTDKSPFSFAFCCVLPSLRWRTLWSLSSQIRCSQVLGQCVSAYCHGELWSKKTWVHWLFRLHFWQ